MYRCKITANKNKPWEYASRCLKVSCSSDKRVYLVHTRLVKLLSRIFKRGTIEISIFAIAIGLLHSEEGIFTAKACDKKALAEFERLQVRMDFTFFFGHSEPRSGSLEGKLSSIKTDFRRYSFSARMEYKRRTLFSPSPHSRCVYSRSRKCMIEEAAAEQLPQIPRRDDRRATFPVRKTVIRDRLLFYSPSRAAGYVFPFSSPSSARERGDCNVVCHERPALSEKS